MAGEPLTIESVEARVVFSAVTEADGEYRTAILVPLDEWAGMDDKARWSACQAQVDAFTTGQAEARNAPPPEPAPPPVLADVLAQAQDAMAQLAFITEQQTAILAQMAVLADVMQQVADRAADSPPDVPVDGG